MDLTYDTPLVVYKIQRELFLKSIHSSFETQIDYGSYVGYSEEYSVLFVGTEEYEYNSKDYIADIMKTDNSTEMRYEDYVSEYKERLNKLHADAPVLNRNTTPSEFDPQNPFQRLLDAGVHIKLS